ncbi:putative magnesium transporter NIPA7 [Smittium culicis]|uniref:Putative magnesium transporter NIPA7 n=1 Tax=Smittium culicis TaxID=133412 RepID=A0A1R1YKW1_9FUNG|nr:putative magnesium transporter NIPA7 [Smittium culicis]
MGLQNAKNEYGSATKGFKYLRSKMWWFGMVSMTLGEAANFVAYTFAPAILVTPLGALSVIFGALFAYFFLGDKINSIGKCGCSLCLIGALIVVANSPDDPVINSVEEIVKFALKPGFLVYSGISIVVMLLLMFVAAPRFGKRNPLTYLGICSLAGAFTVIATKAFGIAVKLTVSGSNQFNRFSTYVFLLLIIIFIALQLSFFNRALANFNTNLVIPIYYVFFTTATIIASSILFGGIDGTAADFISIVCGFFTLFIGVLLLNISREKPQLDPMLELDVYNHDNPDCPNESLISQTPDTRIDIHSSTSNDCEKYIIKDDSFDNQTISIPCNSKQKPLL